MNRWFHRLEQDDRFSRRVTIGFTAVLAVLVIVLVIALFVPARKENGNSSAAVSSQETSPVFSEEAAAEMSSLPSDSWEAAGETPTLRSDFGETSAAMTSAFTGESDADVSSASGRHSTSVIGIIDSLGTTLRDDAHGIGEIAAETASDPYRDKPDVDITSWEFILANPWNDIGDYTPSLATLEGQQFDERIIGAMEDFVKGARDEGLSVVLSSGYRSYETQTYLFNRKVAQYGEEVAATIVARPGTSEHQTGLCCDITDQYYEMKDESLENTSLYKWMSKHCQEYGFIVRFPKGKQDITGIIYEPWHFRYVGVEAATYIMENDLTLEEFLDLYR